MAKTTRQQRLLAQSRKVMQQEIHHADHPKAITRRQMLSSGMISMGVWAATPTLISLMAKKAYAQTVCNAGGATGVSTVPYLHFELNGGASIAGNFMFGKQKDAAPIEFLGPQSYGTLGLPPELHPSIVGPDMTFGAPFHPLSAMLEGMNSVMSPEAIAKTAVAGGAGTSADDTANNQLNGVQLAIAAAQSNGQLVQIAGTQATNTGGRTASLPVGSDPSLSKVRISRSQDVLALIDPGLLASRLSRTAAEKIVMASKKMSDRQLAMFQNKDLPAQVKELVQCGYLGSKDLISEFDEETLNPAGDTAIQGLFDLNNADDQRVASIAKLLLDGNAAAGTIENGGYDYHGLGRVTQDARDFAAGRRIGLALELAHRKTQPLFIAVTSDGSVAANNNSAPNAGAGGKYNFVSDSGSRGAYLMFAIGRTVRPEMNSTQIGAFRDSGAVDTAYLATASSPSTQALNIVYNYASLNDKIGSFEAALSKNGAQNPFKGQDAQYLAFRPLKA